MNRKIVIPLILILLAAALFAVNRDLFRYTYDTRLERSFLPEQDEKQDYLISESITLKPGAYLLSMSMTAEGQRSALFLQDSGGEIFFYEDLEPGTADPSFPFTVEGGAKQVRLGVRYDPEHSEIHIRRMRITAEHVLYKDSLLRHLTLSALITLTALVLLLRLCFPERFRTLFPVFADRRNETALAVLILLTLASAYPLLDGKTYIHGEDMFFHLTRIKGLAESLRAGYFPVRDQLYWLHDYGYGTGFFYPDVFLYLPAVLVLLGFGILSAYKIFLVLCSFAAILSAWYAAVRISGKRAAGYGAAVLTAFAAYRLSNLYYRGTVGETQAAVFFPLIILGLYEIFHGDPRRWPFFAFGFLGLLCCHVISLTMALVLTAVFFLIHIRRILSDRQVFLAILRSVLLAAGLGAFFWIPMLEQTAANPGLRVNRLLAGTSRLNRMNYAFPAGNLLLRFSKWSNIRQAESVYPGWGLLAVPLLALLPGRKRDRSVKAADLMLAAALILLWMCTRTFPWQLGIFLPFVTRIQFAYRLLLPATSLMALAGGIYLASVKALRHRAALTAVLALFCFFSTAYPVLRESVRHRSVAKDLFVMQDNRVSGGEYLPKRLKQEFPGQNGDTVFLTDGGTGLKVTGHDRRRLTFRFGFELPEDSGEVRFSLPLIWYKGFRGTVTGPDGLTVKQDPVPDDRGLVSITSAGFPAGEVYVSYEKTPWQIFAEALTLLTAAAALLKRAKKRARAEGITGSAENRPHMPETGTGKEQI